MRNSRNNPRSGGKSFGSNRSSANKPFERNSRSSSNTSSRPRNTKDGDFSRSKPSGFRKEGGDFGAKKTWGGNDSKPRFERKETIRGGFSGRTSRSEDGSERKTTSFTKRSNEGSGFRSNDRFEKKTERPDRSRNDKPRAFDADKKSRPKRSFNDDNRFDKKKDSGEKPSFPKRTSSFSRSKPGSSATKTKIDEIKSQRTDRGRGFQNKPFSREDKPKRFGDRSRETDSFRMRVDEDETQAPKSSEDKSFYAGKGKRVVRKKAIDVQTPTYSKNFKTRTNKATKPKPTNSEDGMRLNRYIANSGVCSRREADLLIRLGEVMVNGETITEMGYKVKPGDTVKYSGRTLKPEKMVYVLLNKPKDYITTTNDPENRRTVMDLVANAANERLFPVGRLDRNTTGLLLLTNDGELADKLAHPSNRVRKIYEVTLDKPLEEKDFERIVKGVHLEDGKADVDEIAVVTPDRKVIGLEIHIGKNRIVRRIFEYLGYEVEKLDRVMYANLTKKDLPRGHWRYLEEKELIAMKYMS